MAAIKINHSAVEAYAKSFASQVCEAHFDSNKEVTGPQILKLTPVKQVNFFVLKLLFESWQEETKKLQSPYFDYKDEKVVKALLAFMNVLSQHIAIKRDDFEPILATAVQESLYLIVTPYDYFWAEINKHKSSTVPLKTLKGRSKYIKSNKHIWEGLIEKAQAEAGDKIDKEILLELLESLGEGGDFQIESYDELIDKFNEVRSLSMDEITEEESAAAVDEDEDVFSSLLEEEDFIEEEENDTSSEANEEIEEEPAQSEAAKEDTEDSYAFEATPEMQSTTPEVEEEAQEDIPDSSIDDTEEEDEPVDMPKPSRSLDEEEEEAPNQLNRKFAEEKTTLHDQLQDREKVTIAEIHETSKKGGIHEGISVNQRYMFINELFNNDVDLYNKAMTDIERCESFDDSVELLIQRYAKKMDWNMNSTEVKELLKIIFKRFR